MRKMRWGAGVLALVLTGCAITPQQFERDRYSMSELAVCKAAVDAIKSGDYSFKSSVESEAGRRGLTGEKCVTLLQEDQRQKAMAAALIIGAIAVAAAARGGGGGGTGSSYAATDYDWDWDMFYNEYRQLVWACRGVQSGQFADQSRCAYKVKADTRWPSLEAVR